MSYPFLIILYGRITDKFHAKQQVMIDGGSTCGYRQYAEKYGRIIYLAQQNCSKHWDVAMTPQEAVGYIETRPDAIVWSVKHDKNKDEHILNNIKNKKVYYSCCSLDTINFNADISLVDTSERVKANGKLWVKGKNPAYWYPKIALKTFDYIMIGKRGDKHESYFIEQLTKKVSEPRSVLWIGGKKHEETICGTHHYITLAPFSSMEIVRDSISMAKVGILLSEISAEGFPQTFLEMTMCGVPVVYSSKAPYNDSYFSHRNSMIVDKEKSVEAAEHLLKTYKDYTSTECRNYAVENYSLDKSYESILRALNE